MGLTPERALEQAEAWLAEPHRVYRTLAIRGVPGTGKTALLRQLADRIPGAVHLDCQGKTADDIAHHLLHAWGVADPPTSLVAGAQRIQSGGVALLGNVQWADKFVTSSEAVRISQRMIRTLKQFSRPTLQFVVERSADKPWVPAPARNDIVLTSPADGEARSQEWLDILTRHPAVQALAAAELRTIPLPVWVELCRGLGIPISPEELAELAESLPDHLLVAEVPGGGWEFGFHAESDRHRIRLLRPTDHGSLLSALLEPLKALGATAWESVGPTGAYAARAAALHATHSGLLETLLTDGQVLANLDAKGLLQGIAATWPRGIPQGGIAIDAHYLEQLGLAAAPHAEWVAWLHHSALNRGDASLARSIATESGVELPWKTVWTRCRPFGTFGRSDESEDFLADQPSEDALGSRDVPELEDSLSWRLRRLGPPVRHIFDRPPGASRPFRSKSRTNGEWLISGPTGPFLVDVAMPPGEQRHLEALPEPFAGPITEAALWRCPAQAVAQNAPTRSWLEGSFGLGTCRVLSEDELPTGLIDSDSRQFLTNVGWPHLTDQLPFVHTADLAQTGLVEAAWPDDVEPPESGGPFYFVAEWTGGRVLLDGGTGALVQDYSTGYSSLVLSTSLRQFCILLRLYHEFLTGPFHTPAERRDVRRSLWQWAEDIDAATEDADHWEHVFDGDLDSWGTE
ncbi:SUKH-4 family immunity protein [Streptomyces sp. NRRL S-481]|uniref:SUKH-4 family immunity protein n=1 Tax=Streptomyces sp. NRRL S-481 TaxID=1463911 RepID=UPI000AEEC6FB|nr:SUKH-4 family immunity protein [Streptomyces sp. NRRL S-481]